MNKSFALELQQALLVAGYEEVELRYLSQNGKNLTLALTFENSTRVIGLLIQDQPSLDRLVAAQLIAIQYRDGDTGSGLPLEFATAADLARRIFDRDPGTKSLPDFRKFTGL